MRRYVYAVAAVLALAPLAAIAPASAANTRPAAPQVPCSGNEEAEVENNVPANWYVGAAAVNGARPPIAVTSA